MHTWEDEFEAKLLALDYGFMPPHAVYPARTRRIYTGKYEPDLWEGNNDRCILLAGYPDATNVLLKYLLDHFDWKTPYDTYETNPPEWICPGYAIDEDVETSAIVTIAAGEWSKPIEFLVWPVELCNVIRLWVNSPTSANITKVKIEIHYEGIWEAPFLNSLLIDEWTDVYLDIDPQLIDRFRLSFLNEGPGDEDVYLSEFDYQPEI
jgi:hypothetical protein